ncbi:MAG TPA: glycosyltransferase family 2 protein, partial [Acidimicrobiales bacterium]
MSDPTVTAVVVTWNSADVIGDCLRSLRVALDGLLSTVVVVDNGSGDDTLARVTAAEPDAVVIANPRNRGLAAANNQGMAARPADFFLIANPDVVFDAGAVRALLDLAGRRPRAGWVAPRLRYEDGRLQTSVGSLPTLAQTLLGRQVARRRAGDEPVGFWWDGWPHTEEHRIGRCLECAYLVRAETVRSVGAQDEHYRLDWEGTDWSERFARAGWELWFTPDAVVTHRGGLSRRQVPYRAVVS